MSHLPTAIALACMVCFTSCASPPQEPLPVALDQEDRLYFAMVDITNLYDGVTQVPANADYSVNGRLCGRGRIGFENMMDCISKMPPRSLLVVDWRMKPFEPSAPLSIIRFPLTHPDDEVRLRNLARSNRWILVLPASITFEDWDAVIAGHLDGRVEFR